MRDTELLDLLGRALKAADHPEATEVSHFEHPGPQGGKVRFADGSTGMATRFSGPAATKGSQQCGLTAGRAS